MEKIYNYLLKVEYDGTGYSGGSTKNSKSIQEKIEKALSKILKSKIKLLELEELTKEFMHSVNMQILKLIKN